MLTDEKRNYVLCIFLAALVFMVIGMVLGTSVQFGQKWQREAVLKGHAIWAVDKDGAPVFQWKSEGEKK